MARSVCPQPVEGGMNKIVHLCEVCGEGIPKPKRGPIGKTCSNACRKKLSRAKPVTPLTKPLKTCDMPSEPAYAASSIVILSEYECLFDSTFDWELAQRLARDFCRPVEWIERGIAACREVGVDPQYFIDRYLYHKPIPLNTEVDRSFRNLGDQAA